jgi:hypothetical protein
MNQLTVEEEQSNHNYDDILISKGKIVRGMPFTIFPKIKITRM